MGVNGSLDFEAQKSAKGSKGFNKGLLKLFLYYL